SQPATASARSVVARSLPGSGMPGRYRGFSWRLSIASTTAASRPHSVVAKPLRAVSVARAVPHEPAPRTASLLLPVSTVIGTPAPGSGVAGRLGRGDVGVAFGLLRLALAQGLGVQGVEVDRLQQERREATGAGQLADDLAHVREQAVRAVGAEQHVRALRRQAGDAEHAGLVDFGHVGGLLADLAGQGDAQGALEGVFVQALDALVEVQLQVRLAGLAEDGRRIGRLEGNVLDVDLLD